MSSYCGTDPCDKNLVGKKGGLEASTTRELVTTMTFTTMPLQTPVE